MGFESFPIQSPFRYIAATKSPLSLSQTRLSHPPKCFPTRQPHCVTTAVAFSSLLAPVVSSGCSLDHKALLHCVVRCPTTTFPLSCGPILPWASFPFKVLPSILNAWPRFSGAIPPKRHRSELVPPERVRSELPSRSESGTQTVHVHSSGRPACAAFRDKNLRRSTKFCRPADTLVSLPLSFSSGLSCTFRFRSTGPVGALWIIFLYFKDRSRLRWR